MPAVTSDRSFAMPFPPVRLRVTFVTRCVFRGSLRALDPSVKCGQEIGVRRAKSSSSKKGEVDMRMRFVRDNDDPKLLSDLERLAGREPEVVAVEAPVDGAEDDVEGADAAAAGEPTPLDDPFVRGFVRASVHLKRYAPFYAGAAAWAATMLLIQPLGDDQATTPTAFAGTVSGTSSASQVAAVAPTSDLNADAIGAPTFEAITGASFAPTTDFDSTSEFAFDDSSSTSFDESSSTTGSSGADDTPTFDFSDDFGSEVEDGLTIVRSGYASATGGTPAEQDPAGGGLPVAVTLGNDTKRSFLALSGSGTELRLRESPEGALQPEAAVIKVCPISSDWEAERGQSINDSPTFESACSTGMRTDGIWTFDLSGFSADQLAAGLTLTPGPGTAHTFEVVLEPNPIPSVSASEG